MIMILRYIRIYFAIPEINFSFSVHFWNWWPFSHLYLKVRKFTEVSADFYHFYVFSKKNTFLLQLSGPIYARNSREWSMAIFLISESFYEQFARNFDLTYNSLVSENCLNFWSRGRIFLKKSEKIKSAIRFYDSLRILKDKINGMNLVKIQLSLLSGFQGRIYFS